MLELCHVGVSFRGRTVIDDVSLSVQSGQIMAILGESGSGKTTLLNTIAGLHMPHVGEIYLNGVLQNPIAVEQRGVAMMFQDFVLLPHLSVLDNAAFGLRMRRWHKTAARERARAALNEAGWQGDWDRPIAHLSGGEQQRVALARALAVEPGVMLLDEPFSGLDAALRGRLQQHIKHVVAQRNIPAVLVSHDFAEACVMAEHVGLLVDGALIQCDRPEVLLQRPMNAQVARLMGCWNVSNSHYIPTEAIVADAKGVACVVESLSRHTTGWHIRLRHPTWGSVQTLSLQKPQLVQNTWSVRILEAHIVSFDSK